MKGKEKCYVAYTDASFKSGQCAGHGFVIKRKGKVLYERRYSSNEDNSVQAELNTIIKLLQFAIEKDLKNIRIRTDYKNFVKLSKRNRVSYRGNIDCRYLYLLLKQTNSKIEWVSRDKNELCDELSRNPNKRKIKKGLMIDWSDKYDRDRNFVRVT